LSQFEFGVAVALVTPVLGGPSGFGAGSSFTSLGTMTPFLVSGTLGNPPSGVSAAAGVCGGGAVVALGVHADNEMAAAADIIHWPIDFIAITRM